MNKVQKAFTGKVRGFRLEELSSGAIRPIDREVPASGPADDQGQLLCVAEGLQEATAKALYNLFQSQCAMESAK